MEDPAPDQDHKQEEQTAHNNEGADQQPSTEQAQLEEKQPSIVERGPSIMPQGVNQQMMNDVQQQDDGQMQPLEEKKEIISPEIMEDMRNIWSVFDLDQKNQVSIIELRTILRALDIDPSADELAVITKTIDPTYSGFITFEKLNEVMEEKLKDVDTLEDLLEEMKKLDKDKDGRIPNPEFKQFMMNLGSKMKLEEVEDFMKEADPKGEGAIDIEELAARLCPPKK